MEQIKRTLRNCHKLLTDLSAVKITPSTDKRIRELIPIIEAAGEHIIELEYPGSDTRTFTGGRGGFRT